STVCVFSSSIQANDSRSRRGPIGPSSAEPGRLTSNHRVVSARYSGSISREPKTPAAAPAVVIATISHFLRLSAARYLCQLIPSDAGGPRADAPASGSSASGAMEGSWPRTDPGTSGDMGNRPQAVEERGGGRGHGEDLQTRDRAPRARS